MIKDNAKAEIEDVNGVSHVTLEVNFDENFKDCVKITIDSSERIVKYPDLFMFMFTLATKEQQAKMIPVQQELGNQYMKQIQVKVTKDLKEGELMVVNVPINVPKIIEEQILYELEQKKLSTDLQSS